MADTKHVGRIIKTKKKCGVVYRVVPGEPENCVVVMTESLDAADHDSLINLINSDTKQWQDHNCLMVVICLLVSILLDVCKKLQLI
jgi:hypothetical protein